MINTFNLEQNLLTFPSEGDILTGKRGCECNARWMAGWSSLNPSESVCMSRPSSPDIPDHTGRHAWRNRVWPPKTHSRQESCTQRHFSCVGGQKEALSQTLRVCQFQEGYSRAHSLIPTGHGHLWPQLVLPQRSET